MNHFKLDEHQKTTAGFKVPEDYFDHLSDKISQKIQQNPKVILLSRTRKKWIYAAAAVLVIGLGITAYNALQIKSATTDAATIENYLASQANTEDILVDLLEKEDIEQLNAGYHLDDQAVEDILANNSNLEHYIIN